MEMVNLVAQEAAVLELLALTPQARREQQAA
jgi:hypothetical protein